MTGTAEADLAEIWAYVAVDSETDATRLLDKIMAAAMRLLDFPSAGPSREQLAPYLRVIFQGNYAIYYTFNETEVIIVRVLHGAHHASAIAAHGGFAFS